MPTPDLVLRGGSVVRQGRVATEDVAIVGESIEFVGQGSSRGEREIDVSGAFVLPGGIDAHVHLNSDWPFPDERQPAEGFLGGTRSAAAGGITTVLDFVYQHADRDLRASVDTIVAAASADSAIDFGFHVAITHWGDGLREAVRPLVTDGFRSFKFYVPMPDVIDRGPAFLDLLSEIAAAGGVGLFHCEDAGLLEWYRQGVAAIGATSPAMYGRSKPPVIEVSATERVVRLAQATGLRAYFVHVSTAEALAAVDRARAAGTQLFVETRPIYLHLTEDRYDAPDAMAARFIGTPPLRSAEDQAVLWKALVDGRVDVVGSDHVGFTLADKYRPGDAFDTVPKGMPNLETMLPMLFSEAVIARGLPATLVARVLAESPARIFGLWPRKGAIEVRSDADLVVIDPAASRVLGPAPLHGTADFDVYEGTIVTGLPLLTISRGDIVYENGEVTATAGRGRLVRQMSAA